MSRVDVIIPCYKYGHFLRGCVQSVLSQEGVDVRVLIIDDASPDSTGEVGRQLAEEDVRVTYWKHPNNRGHIATYNEGLEWASGDYTLLLSADDFLTPGALGRAASLLDNHPEVGLVYGKEIIWEEGSALPTFPRLPQSYDWRILSGEEFLVSNCTNGGNPVPTPTAVVRTTFQRHLGGYRSTLPHSGDLEMWLRFAVHGSIGIIETEQAVTRIHGKNMRNDYDDIQNLWQLQAAYEFLFSEHRDRIKDWQRLQRSVTQLLARRAFFGANDCFDRGNTATCQSYLDLARVLDPKIEAWPPWSRLRFKRRMGLKLWRILKSLSGLLRVNRCNTQR